MNEPLIEHGFASLGRGTWLISRGQPAVAVGSFSLKGIGGFLAPDRRHLMVLTTEQTAHLACANRPFLTHLVSVGSLTVRSEKLLVAPLEARAGGRLFRVIPFSGRRAFPLTRLTSEWVVVATKSRLKRILLAEGEVACVRCEAVVAWTGKDPTCRARRIRLRDLVLPKPNVALSLHFYGPQVLWVEGTDGL